MNNSIKFYYPFLFYLYFSGGHRPVWPQYGEYNYLPTQRWLHSLEHGAVVMLYHPCANYNEVVHLKDIVRNCMYRHIITASNDLHQDRVGLQYNWDKLSKLKITHVFSVAISVVNMGKPNVYVEIWCAHCRQIYLDLR